MKRHLSLFQMIALILIASAGGANSADHKQTVETLNKQIDLYSVPFNNWKYRSKCDEKCFRTDVPENWNWKTASPGFYWPEAFQTFWFRRVYTIPEQVAGQNIAGSKITLKMNVSDSADAYINGVKVGNANDGVTIAEKAAPGEKLVIGVKVSNGTWPGAYISSALTFSSFNEITERTREYIDLVSSAQTLIPFSKEPDRYTKILDDSAAKVDTAALSAFDEKKYHASLDDASVALQQLGPLFKDYTVFLDGYSHIDLAWLWDKAEGEIVTRDTLNTVFNLLDEYPEWIFSFSQAHGAKWMEDDYPELFAKLQKFVKEGRIELVGGTWCEHDSNLPSGEGFVRQFLYGKRYFREKFGKDIVVAWTPDSFGYNWNLPQILVKSGMTGFLTQKLGSNESTRFPHNIFWWEGADGSKVLTYFPLSGYANNIMRREIIGHLASLKSNHGVNENYVIFGVGDHGGGVTRGHLDRAFSLKNDPISPNVVFTSADSFYKHLTELSESIPFPTWNDELYLEHHRGTYTSQANNKKHNRRTEQLLLDSEKLASIAETLFDALYPAKELFSSGWYYVLLNHMHDILPGSGIRKVYEDSDKDYAEVYKTAGTVINDSLEKIASAVNTEGPGEPLLVFNTLSWTRDAVIEQPFDGLEPSVEVTDPKGNPVVAQITRKDGKPHILFIARGLPPGGYTVYRVFPSGRLEKPEPPSSTLKSGPGFIENNFIKASYDPLSGDLNGIHDKSLGREFLDTQKNSNLIQAFKDTQNAWEILTNDPIETDAATDVRIVESGPVRITLEATRKLNDSTFVKHISLYDNDPLIHGRIDVQWREHNTTTKLAFFLNLLNDDAWFEIPYAAISRKAIPKTAAEIAKFEVSAQNWVDYTDKDGAAGISLLNNSKYGFDVKQNVLRMTLLRSPIKPDPEADQGDHSIQYALYTHAGDWRAADTSRRGFEFNHPPHTVRPGKHIGSLQPSNSFFKSEPNDVAISAIKKSEEGDGYVIRVVETEGNPVNATISLPWNPVKIVETNLIEDEIKSTSPVKLDENKLSFNLGKYEIKTLKIFLK